ncbi:MAG: FAD-binding oxidoreductase, partial [Pseudomonadota bacterium]
MTYSARRLPVHRGPAAWAEILGNDRQYPELTGETTADVAIVGAGFAGIAAARRVNQLDPTARVTLLEAGRIAEGGTGRNSGFMIDLPHDLSSDDYAGAGDDRQLTALNRHAIGFARQAVQDYGIPSDYFDPAGKVNGAATARGDTHNRSYAAHLAALGEPHEWLDAQAMQDLTGSAHYRSGLYTPGTVMLQPAGFVRKFVQGLSNAVQVHENAAVISLVHTGPDWRVETQKGAVTAARVILAVNGHLESFGIAAGRLVQLFLFASMSAEMDATARATLGGAPRWGITPSDPMGTTMRRIDTGQGGHRIITRTAAVVRPDLQATRADMTRAARKHSTQFAARFPSLRDLRQEYVWSGHLCLSLNGVAHCHEVEPGLFTACVQNGLGSTRGTLTGIAAAERAMGHRSAVTDHFDAQETPKRLPPLAGLGA